jgi:glucose/mannose-6-phosphate isomerase
MDDFEGFKKILADFGSHFNEAKKLGRNEKFENIKNIMVCAMGGSAVASDFVSALFYPNLKIQVLRDYILPGYVDDSWLCIFISYSGSTEETITAYGQAIKKTKNIAVITSGGKLEELAKKNSNSLILMPKGLQPRLAFAYQALPIINILSSSKLIAFDLEKEGKKVSELLGNDFEKEANAIIDNLTGILIIYSSQRNQCLSYKWKISFNENSKAPAFSNTFPEFNHNEINGFANTSSEFTILMLQDSEDYMNIKKRFAIVSDIFKEKGLKVIEAKLKGKNRLSKLIYGMLLADWAAYLYAKKTDVNPLTVPIIDDLKKRLIL